MVHFKARGVLQALSGAEALDNSTNKGFYGWVKLDYVTLCIIIGFLKQDLS
jgi:hypothetical protein